MNSRMITPMAGAALFDTGCVQLKRASDVNLFRDAEVVMVLRVANLAEVREGNFARDRATAQAVKDFASMMASEHAQAASKTDNDLAKKEIPSLDSDLGRKIDAESGKSVEALRTHTRAPSDPPH